MSEQGSRKLAPHVEAAIARSPGPTAQGKPGEQGGGRAVAAHVQAALARAAQPQLPPPASRSGRPEPAAHVRAAIAPSGIQPKLGPPRASTWSAPPRNAVSALVQASSRSQSCEATLYIGGRRYDGSTGKGHGHAEMDALHDFIDDFGLEAAVDALGRYKSLKVRCESRPVCSQCGAVLRALGFVPYDTDTEWGETTMGSTEWSVSMNVKALLAAFDIDIKEILRMRKGYAL